MGSWKNGDPRIEARVATRRANQEVMFYCLECSSTETISSEEQATRMPLKLSRSRLGFFDHIKSAFDRPDAFIGKIIDIEARLDDVIKRRCQVRSCVKATHTSI